MQKGVVRRMLFPVGRVKISQQVLEGSTSAQELIDGFSRYLSGDWGDVSLQDGLANDLAITTGNRIVAQYSSYGGEFFYITTYGRTTEILTSQEVAERSLKSTSSAAR